MPDASHNLIYAYGGEVDEGEFSLVITSDDLDPAEITRLLGVEPTDSHRRGDLNRAGKPFKFGRWRFATKRLDFRADTACCRKCFDTFVESLPNAPGAWSRVSREYDAQVFIHLWMKTWNREFDLSPYALAELARRHLSLHIDTYFVAKDTE